MPVPQFYDESISKKRQLAFAGRIKRARPVHRHQDEARPVQISNPYPKAATEGIQITIALGCHLLFCKFPPDIMKLRHIVALKFQVSIHNTANALLMSLGLSVFHF
jgi:hypothetical protein